MEWGFYLRLLGEDEGDSRRHARSTPAAERKATDRHHPASKESSEEKPQWSWIGHRSPLMGEQDEAEWLLERLFIRLEQSMHGQWMDFTKKNKGQDESNANEDENTPVGSCSSQQEVSPTKRMSKGS